VPGKNVHVGIVREQVLPVKNFQQTTDLRGLRWPDFGSLQREVWSIICCKIAQNPVHFPHVIDFRSLFPHPRRT